MAEARSSFDRSQLKTNDNIHGRSPWVSCSGSLTTRRNVSCSSGNYGPNYMLSSNLACHSAGLSVHGLFMDIELDSSAGYLATSRHVCLLRSFLAQYRFELLDCKHNQSTKITKTSPLERERTLDIRQHWGGLLVFLAFIFLIRMLQTVRLLSLCFERVCFACGEVIKMEAVVVSEWWQ
jgi:hypothetical protein